MIIENGHIEIHCKVGAGFDSEHNPIAPSYNVVSVKCQYEQKNRVLQQSENGEYISSGYNIFIDIKNLPELKKSGKIKLFSNTIGELGTFDVIGTDVLELVGQIKISV